MRHVDDGALHAWLDGELDAYPPREAAWIREHLEHCSECASRLEAERAVRDRAEAILAGAQVDTSGLPSLEEMRRRARAEDARGGGAGGARVRVRRTAWAASIILAAGAGWMANSLFPRLEGEEDPAVQFLRPGEEPLVTPEPRLEMEVDLGAPGSEAVEGAGGEESRPAPTPEGGETVEKTSPRAIQLPAPDAAPAEPTALADAERRSRTAGALELQAVPEPQGAVLLRRAVEGQPTAGLAIPGLEILETSFLTPGDVPGGLRVLQRLPQGDTVAVYHLPAERTPDSLSPLGDGESQWAAPRGGGWVVVRGRLPAETLAELGERLPGG